MLVAGNATTVNMIALGVITFLEHDDQLKEMMDDEDLINNAVEELLRYHTASALATKRVAIEDVQVGDVVSSKAHKQYSICVQCPYAHVHCTTYSSKLLLRCAVRA
eukprot:2572-Heterococcus_DN1.PRE.1